MWNGPLAACTQNHALYWNSYDRVEPGSNGGSGWRSRTWMVGVSHRRVTTGNSSKFWPGAGALA